MRTAMDEEQRDGVLDLALLVHIMDTERPEPVDPDIARELRDPIQCLLGLAPVEALAPPIDEPLDVRERRAVRVPDVLQLVGEAREREIRAEELEGRVGDVQLERLFGHAGEVCMCRCACA